MSRIPVVGDHGRARRSHQRMSLFELLVYDPALDLKAGARLVQLALPLREAAEISPHHFDEAVVFDPASAGHHQICGSVDGGKIIRYTVVVEGCQGLRRAEDRAAQRMIGPEA